MQSVVSYPDRGPWGNNKYRGNMSGYLVKDIIEQYHLRQLSDYMVGGEQQRMSVVTWKFQEPSSTSTVALICFRWISRNALRM